MLIMIFVVMAGWMAGYKLLEGPFVVVVVTELRKGGGAGFLFLQIFCYVDLYF